MAVFIPTVGTVRYFDLDHAERYIEVVPLKQIKVSNIGDKVLRIEQLYGELRPGYIIKESWKYGLYRKEDEISKQKYLYFQINSTLGKRKNLSLCHDGVNPCCASVQINSDANISIWLKDDEGREVGIKITSNVLAAIKAALT